MTAGERQSPPPRTSSVNGLAIVGAPRPHAVAR